MTWQVGHRLFAAHHPWSLMTWQVRVLALGVSDDLKPHTAKVLQDIDAAVDAVSGHEPDWKWPLFSGARRQPSLSLTASDAVG
jgi:hypothetical protein